MRYKLQVSSDHGKTWTDMPTGSRTFRSKKSVDEYVDDYNTKGLIDWRVGWLFKLRSSENQFNFVKIIS